jgi:hypothetical protein
MKKILSQKLNRRDAETQSFFRMKKKTSLQNKSFIKVFLCLCVSAVIFIFASCGSKPVDLRTVAPVDSLIYIEMNNLGRSLESLTENNTFRELAQTATDFSPLRDVQVAIVVTGFEASEKELTDKNSILNFKPRFVAIADTHFWESQTKKLTEETLGSFINRTYGGEVNLEISGKYDGTWYDWRSVDGREVFAYVEGSQIFFGNDETAIEKCLAVKRGESENLTSNESFMRVSGIKTEKDMAFGYIAPEGIAQIANIIGVSTAIESTEDGDGRSFIAQVLPDILRNTTKEISWTAQKTETGIEDKVFITTKDEVSSVLSETMKPTPENNTNFVEFLPQQPFSATLYSLQNPQVAWRSLVVVSSGNADAVRGELLQQFSESLLEPYGISKAEDFLSSIDTEIITAQFDSEGEESIVIVKVKDLEKLKKSITNEINFNTQPEKKDDAEIWNTKDKSLSAAFVGDVLILGDAESIAQCLQAKKGGQNFTKNTSYQQFANSKAVAATYSEDLESGAKLVEIMGIPKQKIKEFTPTFMTETNFTKKGVERRTVSDFGILGMILEQTEE